MNRSCITQRGLVLLLLVSTFCPALYAGFRPEQNVITTEADAPTSVYAADLDGDGDLDVLSASSYDDKIAWYANDGTGHFGRQQVIRTEGDVAPSVYSAQSVCAADLDGDGDLDVLSPSMRGNEIAWYANDGSGHFGAEQVVTTEASDVTGVYAADLDGDGDLDVLSTLRVYYEDGDYDIWYIVWYANDGSGHFGPQQEIGGGLGMEPLCVADLDDDGDLDVLAAFEDWNEAYCNCYIAWYANDGSGHFGRDQPIAPEWPSQQYACYVYVGDLDGDGDLDVLSAHYWAGLFRLESKITWHANDGSGHFGPEQRIAWPLQEYAQRVYAADLDGDGDLDVLSASSSEDKIAWYANDGSGHFATRQVITTTPGGACSMHVADLDGDGDLDILSAGGNTIAWYENE